MAGRDGSDPAAHPVAALQHLADAGVLALVRLDERVVVTGRFGKLAQLIPDGADLCRDVPVFAGLRPDLLALQDDPQAVFVLPNVGLFQARQQIKLSFEAFWQAAASEYHLVIHRLGLVSESELDLARQQRMRRIAEDHLRLARAELIERQNLRELIIDHAPVPIALFDRELTCLFATRRWTEIFGTALQPLAGHFGRADMGGGDPDVGRRIIERCLAGETVTTRIEPIEVEPGRTEWIGWIHSPWRRANGTVGGIISFADVETQMVASRQELEDKNAELARTNRELDAFSSIISHDLRAPLRAIEYAAADLRRAAPSGAPSAALDQISRSVVRMSQMLAELLDYARIGRVAGEAEEIDLDVLIADICGSIPEASRFDVSCDLARASILADRAPLDIVIRNLIENAIRHHDRDAGRIRIGLEDMGDRWRFCVADDGPGIDPAHHAMIFEPFRQVSPKPGERSGGMGLAHVAKTVALYGGGIEVLSNPAHARGTTFRFSWPQGETGASVLRDGGRSLEEVPRNPGEIDR